MGPPLRVEMPATGFICLVPSLNVASHIVGRDVKQLELELTEVRSNGFLYVLIWNLSSFSRELSRERESACTVKDFVH